MWCGPSVQEKAGFPGSESKGREHKNKKATENQCQAIWQTTHSLSSISFPSWEAWGKMIHDLHCNNTDTWPVLYIFHSTCSFNVSSTIKQGPLTVSAFSFRPWLGVDFCLLRWSISCLPTTAHMSSVWRSDLICSFAYRMCSISLCSILQL